MKRFSVVRVGNEYVVRVNAQSILKVSSRRKAAKLVSEAVGLLDRMPSVPRDERPSTGRDRPEVP